MSIGMLLLAGCVSSGSYHILTGSADTHRYRHKQLGSIGVEKILVPQYLQQDKVAVMLSPTQIDYLDRFRWAEEMDSSLTNQLISAIQKSFSHPNVHLYPWELSQPAKVKVKVSISRFIAYQNRVYLDAGWEIYDLRNNRRYSRLFSTAVPCGSDGGSIVAGMDIAYAQLSQSIIKEINDHF